MREYVGYFVLMFYSLRFSNVFNPGAQTKKTMDLKFRFYLKFHTLSWLQRSGNQNPGPKIQVFNPLIKLNKKRVQN